MYRAALIVLVAGAALMGAGGLGRDPALVYAAMVYFGAVIGLVVLELMVKVRGR
jgi:hypothetical protein